MGVALPQLRPGLTISCPEFVDVFFSADDDGSDGGDDDGDGNGGGDGFSEVRAAVVCVTCPTRNLLRSSRLAI